MNEIEKRNEVTTDIYCRKDGKILALGGLSGEDLYKSR